MFYDKEAGVEAGADEAVVVQYQGAVLVTRNVEG